MELAVNKIENKIEIENVLICVYDSSDFIFPLWKANLERAKKKIHNLNIIYYSKEEYLIRMKKHIKITPYISYFFNNELLYERYGFVRAERLLVEILNKRLLYH